MKPLYKQKYPHVFEPLTVGKNKNITFKNRIFQAPVGVGATGGGADDGRMNLIGVDFWYCPQRFCWLHSANGSAT